MKKIIVPVLLLLLVGCGSPLLNPNVTSDYTRGCMAVSSSSQLGILQIGTGSVESCKLRCTDELPEGYTLDYSNPEIGCHATIRKEKVIVDDKEGVQ